MWQTFVASVQATINQYRNEIFGASLTGNELKAANISLPDWNKDAAGTIFTKLNSMYSYADTFRNSALGEASGGMMGDRPTSVTPFGGNTTTSATDALNEYLGPDYSLETGVTVSSTPSTSDEGFWQKFVNVFKW